MKSSRSLGIVKTIIFCSAIVGCSCGVSWADQLQEDLGDVKVLINEVRQLRTDLQRYSNVSYKVQAYLGMLQIQIMKLNTARDGLAGIGSEIDNLVAQNASDKEELDKLRDQMSQEILDKNYLNIQIKDMMKAISDRDKLIEDLRTKEVLMDGELKEEQKKLEAISSHINMLELDLKGR